MAITLNDLVKRWNDDLRWQKMGFSNNETDCRTIEELVDGRTRTMSEAKYKVGDKFIFTIDAVDEAFGGVTYKANGLSFTQYALDAVERYDEAKIVREAIQRRIDELMAMVVAFEKERDVLCEYMNRKDGDGLG